MKLKERKVEKKKVEWTRHHNEKRQRQRHYVRVDLMEEKNLSIVNFKKFNWHKDNE